MNGVFLLRQSFMCAAHQGCNPNEIFRAPAAHDWFDANLHLGKKGHRYFSNPVKYVLAAAQPIIGGGKDIPAGSKSGIFIGTNTADISARENISQNLLKTGDSNLGAASAPNSSANIAASVLAERASFNGPSFTFTGGEDTALFALWKAFNLIDKGELVRAIVGQTEHCDAAPATAGAILWELSNQVDDGNPHISSIKLWRWDYHKKDVFKASKENENEVIYFIGRDCEKTNQFTQHLNETGINFERIWDRSMSQSIDMNMQLFANLSLFMLSQASGNIFVMSNNGHIFNLNLEIRRKP